MSGIREKLKNVRLVFRRSSILMRCVIIAAIVLSTAALLTLRTAQIDAQAKADDLKSQAAQLEQDKNKLEQDIANLGSLDSLEQIAKDELGLVNPDCVLISPNP